MLKTKGFRDVSVPQPSRRGKAVPALTLGCGHNAENGLTCLEMHYFLHTLGVDAVFTDNPDQFPSSPQPDQSV